MADITAAAVKAFRDRTGLPLMDCKRALTEANGDEDVAYDLLRREGKKLADTRSGRETAFGRFGMYFGLDKPVGAMVELKVESAPVAGHEDAIQFANDMARQLAEGPGAATVDELLQQPAPGQAGATLGDVKESLFNRIREVFNVGRIVRLDGTCGGYSHNAATVAGVLLEVAGGTDEAAKDICMHIAAMRPQALTVADLDPAVVAKERELLRQAALNEGKPEKIVDKMVEGRLKAFYAETVLLEQPFVKENKLTVGQYAEQNGMQVKRFVHWELGRE